MRKALSPGDVFVVSAIDRAFRSVIDAVVFLDDVMKCGITFRSRAPLPKGRGNRWSRFYVFY